MIKQSVHLFLAAILTIPAPSYACSFIQLGAEQDYASAQNFDFVPETLAGIIINKRNLQKADGAFDGMPAAPAAQWVSKYGSITFGLGRESAAIGVNEAGLRAYRFLFMKAQYPAANSLPALHENDYVQYILDTAQSIDEVVEQTKAIQIYRTSKYPGHFAFCDRSAQCAIVEAANGKLNIITGTDVKVSALTNTDYTRSLDLLTKCPTGDCGYINTNSEWRFVKAATQVRQFTGLDFKAGVLDILNSVNEHYPDQATPTLWTVLTHENATTSKFYVKNTKFSKFVLEVDYKNFDYSCTTPTQVALLDPNDANTLTFADYTLSFQQTLLDIVGKYLDVSQADLKKRLAYPDTAICLEQSKNSIVSDQL